MKDKTVEKLIDSEPEVYEHLVIDPDRPGINQETLDLRDKWGRPFDPKLHVSDDQGKPVVNTSKNLKGTLKLKPGAPKPSKSHVDRSDLKHNVGTKVPLSRESKGAIQEDPDPIDPEKPDKTSISPAIAGQMAAELQFTVGMAFGGEEWKPRKEPYDEWELVSNSWAGYFAASGGAELAPGKLLLFSIALYALPRFTMPQTQKRMGFFGRFLKKMVSKIKGFLNRGSRSNNRTNRSRKNNEGKTVSRAAEVEK